MLEKITSGLAAIINDCDVREISKKSVLDFANFVVNNDHVSLVESIDDTRNLIWQILLPSKESGM